MERTEMKMSSSKWKKHLGTITFFVALFLAVFTVESVHAQSFTGQTAVPYALSSKANNGQGVNFIPASEVAQVLKPEIATLEADAPNWNGGTDEVAGYLRLTFYNDILNSLETGDTVEDAVLSSYRKMLGAAGGHDTAVNTDVILQDAINLLSN